MLKVGLKQMLDEANAEITTRSVEEVKALHESGTVVLVDVRDGIELQNGGTIPGAVHASRGLLEMHVDPSHPAHISIFAEDREFVLF